MITFRLILAAVLAVLPLIRAAYHSILVAREKERTNLWMVLGRKIPFVGLICYSIEGFLKTLTKRMRTSENARKLYTVLLLLTLLVFTFVDYAASREAMSLMDDMIQHGYEVTADDDFIIEELAWKKYGNMVSDVYVLFACQVLTFAFFSYRFADWLLSSVHGSKELTWMTVLLILMIVVYCALMTPKYLILAVVIYIILLASLYYPDRDVDASPKGRQGIPLSKENSFLQAA